MTTGPAAEIRRTGAWRWTVTLTGVRSHARPRTVHGPAWWARRRAAAILVRAAGGDRPPDYVVRLAAAPGHLDPGRAARQIPGGGPVNLYRSHMPGWAGPVRVIGPDGAVAWEGTSEPGDPGGEVVAIWPAGPPGPGHYHAGFGPPRPRDAGDLRGGFLP